MVVSCTKSILLYATIGLRDTHVIIVAIDTFNINFENKMRDGIVKNKCFYVKPDILELSSCVKNISMLRGQTAYFDFLQK